MSTITQDQVNHIFRSETSEPAALLTRRLSVLREAGQVLLEKFQGKFSNVLKSANQSAMSLLEIVTANFSSYRDESNFEWQGKEISCI